MVYAVLSDIHAHSFTLFGKTGSDGVNSRLRIILDEWERAADVLLDLGGKRMFIAGDLFHTRGQIDPEVLNPVRATVESILARGISIYAIPGNHDLKSAETQELSSSIQNLSQVALTGGQFEVFNKPTYTTFGDQNALFVPWQNTTEGLLAQLQDIADNWSNVDRSQTDLFIHAGIDGVLSGMPGHGLSHTDLGAFGFRRVFAGHYHNHKDFGNGVVSIGATTHHNWGDIGTRAGFLIVEKATGKITFHQSKAPHFIDVSGMTEEDMMFAVPGNYARFRGPTMTNDQVDELRDALVQFGAIGTSIEVPRSQTVLRTNTPGKAMTIEQSIEAFVKASPSATIKPEDVIRRAIETLSASQAVAD
jgi:hypothetical protein